MSAREILAILLIIYLLVGVVLWCMGIYSFGGVEKYKAYLSDELKTSPSTIYLAFVVFIVTWPTFIRKE